MFGAAFGEGIKCMLRDRPGLAPLKSCIAFLPLQTSSRCPLLTVLCCRRSYSPLRLVIQARNHRRRKVRCIPSSRAESASWIACRHSAQLRGGQQRIEAPSSPRSDWQNHRGEADPTRAARAPVLTLSEPGNLDCADIRCDVARRAMAVPHGPARPSALASARRRLRKAVIPSGRPGRTDHALYCGEFVAVHDQPQTTDRRAGF
ncbi:hypothetical protein ABH973_003758 [Bradyrhizobium ottawaense]